MEPIILIPVLVLAAILFAILIVRLTRVQQRAVLNTQIEAENAQLQLKNEELKKQQEEYTKGAENARVLFISCTQDLDDIRQKIKQAQEEAKEEQGKAVIQYSDALEASYQLAEKEYDNYIQLLKESYEQLQDTEIANFEKTKKDNAEKIAAAEVSLRQELEKLQGEVEKMRNTRTAAQEAMLREEEIKKQKEFYSLSISEPDLNDIRTLEKIKPLLNKPRVLNMLIWTTWFRTPMTTLCNNVLGAKPITGIYKITNQLTSQCYIGQAVDVASRWKDHAKFGLGIDTPVGNKLYASMQEYGIWSFTWELLEECPQEQLNEKEKFYIDLYDSKNFGLNLTKGNK